MNPLTVISKTVGAVYWVGTALLACRAAVELKHKYDTRKAIKRRLETATTEHAHEMDFGPLKEQAE